MLEEILILLQIIFIDIILAADNAIIIGLIAANFAPKNRKQIILWGVAGALIFKIIFAIFATKVSKEPSYIQSVYKVLFADITISFDNVIGVVGAAKGNFGFMIFGLVLSVILTGAMATYLANYIQRHLWIAYIGLGFILLVAIQLVIGGLVDLDILSINEEFRKYF